MTRKWVKYPKIRLFLKAEDMKVRFDQNGLIAEKDGKKAHLDIIAMDGRKVDFNSNPASKVEDLEVFLQVFYTDWETKLKWLLW